MVFHTPIQARSGWSLQFILDRRAYKRKAWEYFFFVDIEGHAQDAPVMEALTELEKRCTLLKVLGSYPKTA